MRDRVKITLSEQERVTLKGLPLDIGKGFEFWRRIADDRGVDARTIMLDGIGAITALPLEHGRDAWCYPLPLKCKRPPTN